jgi:hypothetical protein
MKLQQQLQQYQKQPSSILELIISWLIVAGFIIAIYYNAYTKDLSLSSSSTPYQVNLTCDNYVLNTFLYVILGLVLIVSLCMLNDRIPIIPEFLFTFQINNIIFNIILIIIIITLLLGLIYLIKSTDPNRTLLINAYWFGFMYILACVFYFIYQYSRILNVFYLGCIIVLIISISTCIISLEYPYLIDTRMKNNILFIFIILFIVAIGIPFIIKDIQTLIKIYIVIIIGFIILFILFLLSEVATLRIKATQCKIPNYPAESLMITYNIWIIFKNVLNLLVFNRLRT